MKLWGHLLCILASSASIHSHVLPHQTRRGFHPTQADEDALDYVRGMMRHAWHNYRKYAWGHDYLAPKSKKHLDHHDKPFAAFTIVDALDTLKLMRLEKEFQQGRDYIDSLTDDSFNVDVYISFFETTIRVVGGLMSAYDVSGDKVFVEKAVLLADRLLPAFNTPTRMPGNRINLKTGHHRSTQRHSAIMRHKHSENGESRPIKSVAAIASNILEFTRLSQVTGNPKYEQAARDCLTALETITGSQLEHPGLYPLLIYLDDGSIVDPKDPEYSVGASGDSFFEYLLKMWILSNKKDEQSGHLYDLFLRELKDNLIKKSHEGLLYIPNGKLSHLNTRMQHLTCFAGGMVALGVLSGRSKNVAEDTEIAAGITETCYLMYARQPIGLSPENVDLRYKSFHSSYPFYSQRPEAIESIYYMWRLTRDPKYREWAWNMAQSINTYTRLEGGFSGIKDIYSHHLEYDDLQNSYFLAETLKYLYLMFESDKYIDFDKWVFNTEAHLIRVDKEYFGKRKFDRHRFSHDK